MGDPSAGLLFAVKKHNLALVRVLLGVEGKEATDKMTMDPTAIVASNIDSTSTLPTSLRADINVVDEDGNTLLHWCSWYRNYTMTCFLLRYISLHDPQSDIIHRSNNKGQRPLHWAAMGGDLQCVNALLQAGAQTEVKDTDGFTPFIAAAQHGHTAVMEVLSLLYQADIHALDNNHRNAVHWAAFKNEMITCQWLIQQGVSFNIKDTGGRLALHWASSENHNQMVSYLVSHRQPQMQVVDRTKTMI